MDGGANNPDGKSKLLPGKLCSVPSISNKILYNLLLLSWLGRQFLETAACFWPLPSNGSLVDSQSYQDGGPLMTSHVTSGFPCCKPGKSVRGKVHLSQKRVSPSNLASQSTSRRPLRRGKRKIGPFHSPCQRPIMERHIFRGPASRREKQECRHSVAVLLPKDLRGSGSVC